MTEFYYHLRSAKGYWLPNAMGYTRSQKEAGVFAASDITRHNLDGVTLITAPEPAPAEPSALSKKLAQMRANSA